MSNWLEDAMGPATARYSAEVMAETWGHLAPEPRRRYPGTIVFTHGAYGDLTPIVVEFGQLPDSPWFFDGVLEFIGSRKTAPGKVYRFSGTYMMCKNGSHRFSGRTRPVRI